MGLKIFNALLVYIKQESDNPKKFESLFEKFLYEKLFCSLEEFYRLFKSQYSHINFILSYVFLLYSCFTQYFLIFSCKDPL